MIAALVSSPAMIRGSWVNSRLRRQVADLEAEQAETKRQVVHLEAEVSRLSPPPEPGEAERKPYVGLKALIAGSEPVDDKD